MVWPCRLTAITFIDIQLLYFIPAFVFISEILTLFIVSLATLVSYLFLLGISLFINLFKCLPLLLNKTGIAADASQSRTRPICKFFKDVNLV